MFQHQLDRDFNENLWAGWADFRPLGDSLFLEIADVAHILGYSYNS
jgi:hypothetical protein